jgi:8-oxo-dGTP diphosphatase
MAPSPPTPIIVGVAGVIWNPQGEVLLIRRRNPPRAGHWSLPGGRVERAERLEDALRREIREETGLEIDILGLAGVAEIVDAAPLGGIGHYVLIDYGARALSGRAVAASDAMDATWFRLDNLPEELWTETRRMIHTSAHLHLGLSPPQ